MIYDEKAGLRICNLLEDDNIYFTDFSYNVQFPNSISELDYGDNDGEYLTYFIPNGDIMNMPPWKGIKISICYDQEALIDTDVKNSDGEKSGIYITIKELEQVGSGSVGVELIHMIVPITWYELTYKFESAEIFQWLYDAAINEYYALTERF